MKFYPIQKRWKKLGPVYRSPEAKAVWLPEMMDYQRQRMADFGVTYAYPQDTPDLRPEDWESCDWRYSQGRKGPQPSFWSFVCHGSCHWLANLSLFVAQQVEPNRPWRIVTSGTHTTVWDGEETLFDANFVALGITPDQTWELAAGQEDSEFLPAGEFMLHNFNLEEAAA